jgi:hypothetical protein
LSVNLKSWDEEFSLLLSLSASGRKCKFGLCKKKQKKLFCFCCFWIQKWKG